MTPLLNRLIEQLLLPPGAMLTGLALALALLHLPRSSPIGARLFRLRFMLGLLLVAGYLCTIPLTAHLLAEARHPHGYRDALTIDQIRRSQAQAIVVFGCGRASKAPEYDQQDTLSPGGLVRVRYAARLHRLTGLPLLMAGGRPYNEERSEAAIMAEVLEQEFHIPVTWKDEASRDTRENALFATAILKQANINRILLVVHHRDMSRALLSFQQAAGNSIQVIPAPMAIRPEFKLSFSWDANDLLLWIPNAEALAMTAMELHEWLGGIWYRLR
ncbi:MAG: YdcF family protein [Magnetococcales bacterium]|nr:YdcF family protein [Magnetococcales bacterium]